MENRMVKGVQNHLQITFNLRQFPHLIDLSRLFLGEFDEVKGFINTYFYNMSVEDNAFLILNDIKKIDIKNCL